MSKCSILKERTNWAVVILVGILASIVCLGLFLTFAYINAVTLAGEGVCHTGISCTGRPAA